MPKTLRIEHPIKVDDKPLYAKIKRVMTGVYKISVYYGKEHLADGTIRATSFGQLVNITRTELEEFLKEIIERR